MLGRPIEGSRPDRFRPPHCPRKDCPAHLDGAPFRWKRNGYYRRGCDPKRKIPRFHTKVCDRGFSRQSFAGSYYMKRPELLLPIAVGLVAGSAHRQLARSLGCAPSTVTRLSARIGRHALLLHALAYGRIPTIDEPVVLDHFETFVGSQQDRLGIATAVGQSSWYVYAFEPAPHRGPGRRSRRKRALKPAAPSAVPGSVVESAREALQPLLTRASGTLRLVSDDHPVYPLAVDARVQHRVFPNPPRGPGADERIARERNRQMFAVDLLHKLLRHSQAHHRRATIAFGRRTNAVIERMALMAVWRNFVKGVSERKNDSTTPAMRLGITERPCSWLEIFARRLFPRRIGLSRHWWKIYRREWITPRAGTNRRHDLQLAF